MIDLEHCTQHSLALKETNDCVVYACAIALQIEYPAMREYLAEFGRKHRDGMYPSEYHLALTELGVSLARLKGPRRAKAHGSCALGRRRR